MKASLKAKYDADKATAASAVTLAFNAGDVKLRASMTDATVVNGPSLNGLALAVDKPGSFSIDYNVPKKDFRFMFMNTIKVSDKPLNLAYSHSLGDQKTVLDGTLVIDSDNKVSVNHVLGSGNCKFKYTYVHGGITTFEPSYDLAKDSWDFAVSRKVYADHVLRAAYQTSSQNLTVDWATKSKLIGSYKVSANFNLDGGVKVPKVTAESTWDFEM
ncbi:putative outer envelope pore protein [Helianthus annuus]|uniref:Outer envelope pore protein n=1 Tax=Helianthus annuus TaxID=4232 RepID=A0A251VFY1_HELAN|nr:outer envelope pore protein 24, chloroplastic [Helianthus annuus]KAF5817917.1 putative outer envelope pore protein [Helianthus annuus]KAJ0618337.1 putative outer envelope pore protein [Helianthus annuus]